MRKGRYEKRDIPCEKFGCEGEREGQLTNFVNLHNHFSGGRLRMVPRILQRPSEAEGPPLRVKMPHQGVLF